MREMDSLPAVQTMGINHLNSVGSTSISSNAMGNLKSNSNEKSASFRQDQSINNAPSSIPAMFTQPKGTKTIRMREMEAELPPPTSFNNTIIGYIHIATIGLWKISFEMLLAAVVNSGLYRRSESIKCIVVAEDTVSFRELSSADQFTSLTKLQFFYGGNISMYERATLHTMKHDAESAVPNTLYWYLHTKGIRRFGTKSESTVKDWIKLMLFWNIEKWRFPLFYLQKYSTYGINLINFPRLHYSGNFWWATAEYLASLDHVIGEGYYDPEMWIGSMIGHNKSRSCCIFTMTDGIHYGWGSYESRLYEWQYKSPEAQFIRIRRDEGPCKVVLAQPRMYTASSSKNHTI